jgi:hypothetical protein
MIRLLLTTTLLLTTAIPTSLSQGYTEIGARQSSLSNAGVCLEDVWSYFHNPAAMTGVKAFSAGVYYDARFLAKELQNQALAVAVPLKAGVISAGAGFSGYEQYRSARAGIGYSLLLGENLSAGVQANMQSLRFGGNYGSSVTGTVEAGLLAKINDKWKVGASVMNIGRQRIARGSDDRYTSTLRFGTLYKAGKKVLATAEIEKQVIHPMSFRAGIEYLPADFLAIRLGAQTGPASFAFGVGYRKMGIFIDLGSDYHQVLGWTPHFGLTCQLAKHAEE